MLDVNKRSSLKAAVAAAFSSAADTYDDSAGLQREVAERLAGRIAGLPLPGQPRILEIGCGTGFLSRALCSLNPSALVVTDISQAMLARCRETLGDIRTARFLTMDGEEPRAAAGSGFDLICSSLTF